LFKLSKATVSSLLVPNSCRSTRLTVQSCISPSLWKNLPADAQAVPLNSGQITFPRYVKTHLYEAIP